jgi:hypothetical protein
MSVEGAGPAPGGEVETGKQAMFTVIVYTDGTMFWKQPPGTDEIFFRGMMDKVKETVVEKFKALAKPSPLAV